MVHAPPSVVHSQRSMVHGPWPRGDDPGGDDIDRDDIGRDDPGCDDHGCDDPSCVHKDACKELFAR